MRKFLLALCVAAVAAALWLLAACGKEPALVSISADGNFRTEYVHGDTFDFEHLIVIAEYDDGTRVVVEDYTADKSTLAYGDTKITLTYGGKTEDIFVFVSKAPQNAPAALLYEIDGNAIVLVPADGRDYEYNFENQGWSKTLRYGDLTYGGTYTVAVRYAATATHEASESFVREITLPKADRPAPEISYTVNGKDLSLAAVGGAEYSVDGGEYSDNLYYRNLSYGKHTIKARYKETDEYNISAEATAEIEIESLADTYNYFSSVYKSLADEGDIRLHTLTYDMLMTLLDTPGRYYLYFGGAWDGKSQSNIKTVNDLAKSMDFEVYNFDMKLDGGIGAELNMTSTLTDGTVVPYEALYLGYEPGGGVTLEDLTVKVASMRDELMERLSLSFLPEATFMAVEVSGGRANIIRRADLPYGMAQVAGEFAEADIFDYFSSSDFHLADGDCAADSGSVFEAVTYHQLIDMLKNGGGNSFELMFGSLSCPNTRAIMSLTDSAARNNGGKTVYFFDMRFNGTKFNIRMSDMSSNTAGSMSFNKLYAYMMSYLDGYRASTADKYDMITAGGTDYERIVTPSLVSFVYDKNSGSYAPILWVDAEYFWEQTQNPQSSEAIRWTQAADKLYNVNSASAADEQSAPLLVTGALMNDI